MPYAAGLAFLASRKEWVKETVLRQSEKLSRPDPDGWHPLAVNRSPEEEAALQKQVAQLRQQAKKELPPRLAALAATYGFTYNRVTIKHNRSNWGSCSRQGNINLNLNLVRLPDPLRDYVLLHELCHLRQAGKMVVFPSTGGLAGVVLVVPAAMVVMEVRTHHIIDVVARRVDLLDIPRHPFPGAFGLIGQGGNAGARGEVAGIDKNRLLRSPD